MRTITDQTEHTLMRAMEYRTVQNGMKSRKMNSGVRLGTENSLNERVSLFPIGMTLVLSIPVLQTRTFTICQKVCCSPTPYRCL